jgi:ketosteroid isomerase-like protein
VDESQVRQIWEAVSQGDFAPLEAILAPDAKWRAVEDGPWNCENRATIVEVMARNVSNGSVGGHLEDITLFGDRVIVAFRPARHDPDAWPLDHGIRSMVLTVRDGLVVEMKGCASRQAALSYAAAA